MSTSQKRFGRASSFALCGAMLPLWADAPAAHAGQAASLLCGQRSTIVRQLQTRFHERQEDTVLRSESSLMELFVSTAGTWSILHTSPKGYSCIVATGAGLRPVARL